MEELNIKSLDESIVSVDSYMDVSSGKYVIDLYANSVGRAFLYVYNNNFIEFIEVCVVYSLSGSELRFDENKWKPAHICHSRNCYTYVVNLYSNVQEIENNVKADIRTMMGYEEGTDEWDNTFRCIDALASEPMTIYGGSFGGKCTAGKYKVVLTVNSNGYMHWYRQDSNGLWSHKMGESFVT